MKKFHRILGGIAGIMLVATLCGCGDKVNTTSSGSQIPSSSMSAPPKKSQDDIDYAVDRALYYPYEDVKESYLLVNGEPYPYVNLKPDQDPMREGEIQIDKKGTTVTVKKFLTDHSNCVGGALPVDAAHRTAVLAYGSNRAPSALRQKFSLLSGFQRGWSVVPVLKAKLADFEVVHAAHYYGNGNLPATIQYAKGVESEVFVTLLDHDELKRMDETEGVDRGAQRGWYHYAKLDNIKLEVDKGTPMSAVYVYIDNYGAVALDGKTFALEKVRGTAVSSKESQKKILEMTEHYVESVKASKEDSRTCDPDSYPGIRGFVCATFIDPCVRAGRTAALKGEHRKHFMKPPPESHITYKVDPDTTTASGNPDSYPWEYRCPHDPYEE
ncbi:MAG: hypothetical protein ACRDRQ_24305 [Pseudonocardiaceae bacterium]